MTHDDLDRLLALAEKATPGPWFTVGAPWLPPNVSTYVIAGCEDPHGGRLVCNFDFRDDHDPDDERDHWDDAEFIASLSPATVRELVALARAGLARETGGRG